LKVSGVQVSPAEIEDVLLANPQKLIIDATVAGVQGGRTKDEKVPRAWVVLSSEGQKIGSTASMKALQEWSNQCLSKYKWLRGGIEVVDEVGTLAIIKRIYCLF
jgi:acyl-CoA synthetase (AMP-forming)/AMP-acid ligase II